jgi:hypothetical protein
MWSLFTSLELRLVHVRPGVEPARALLFSFFFFVVKSALRGMPNARRMHDSFCVMRLLSLSSIARVKGGAESALERFEESQKEIKKSLFVGSAQFSLVV